MKKQKVLVTGANGMLGSSLCPLLTGEGHEAIFADLHGVNGLEKMDVRDFDQVKFHINRFRPTLVFHLAAETDVDGCETDIDHAYTTNTLGTENVALACQEIGAEMVYISTGGVFDGEKGLPYTEFDTPNPVNVYARTKWEGERAAQSLLQRYFIVRVGWMIGGGLKDKKFVAKIVKQLEIQNEISAVTDKWGCPTFTEDLAPNLLRLISTGRYGLYHMVNEGSCTRFDIATKIVEFMGSRAVVKPVTSDAFPLPAPRPKSEILENYKLKLLGLNGMRPWEEGLRVYLSTLLTPVRKEV